MTHLKLKELYEDRAKIAQQMEKLNAEAVKNNRDLTSKELDEFEKLEDEHDKLTDEIREYEEQERELAGKSKPVNENPFSDYSEKRIYSQGEKLAEKPALVSIGDFMRCLFDRTKDGGTGFKTSAEEKYFARSLQASTGSGSYTVPTLIGRMLFDKLRAQSCIFKAGAQTIPLESYTTNFVKVTADNTQAGWKAEGDELTPGDPTLTTVSFTPKNYASMTKVSFQAAHDTVNLADVLEMQLTRSFQEAIETACLMGTGSSNQPKGVYYQTDLACSFNAADADLGDWLDICALIAEIEAEGVEPTGIMMHPRTYWDLVSLVDGVDNPLQMPAGLPPIFRTSAIPIDMHSSDNTAVIAGDFRRLFVAIREPITIRVLDQLYANYLEYGWLGYVRMDCQVSHGAAFGKIHGIAPKSGMPT